MTASGMSHQPIVWMNWLKAMRTRTQPNANVDHGFSHSIVCIMAGQSYWSGKRLYWNPESEEIVEQPVKRSSRNS